MTAGSETLYYVLREGSTREEQWSWEDVEELCRAGELSGRARIFLPEEDRWAAIEETRLAGSLGAGPSRRDDAGAEQRARIEEEYTSALERLEQDPDVLEARLDAGMLAAELGRRDEAREHFQTVLHHFPFHARAAAEVQRRFSKVEQKTFRYLHRPGPVWEDLGEFLRMPFARGPLYVVIPMALFAGLEWLPGGTIMAGALAFLWAFQVMEYTARGATKPAEWNRSFKDPVRKLLRPALLMSTVVSEYLVVMFAVVKVARLLDGGAQQPSSLWQFVMQSPVLLVLGSILGLLYLPVAMVSIGGFTGTVRRTLDPRRLVRTIVRMEHEYVYSVILIALVALLLGVVRWTLGGIPVFGEIIFAAALACAAPMCGLILGRLLGRMGHVIE